VVVNPYPRLSQPICPAPASSLSGDCCCNCTLQSTCKTRKCRCVQAGTPCQSCHCRDKCCNCATNSKFPVSVHPTDELVPPTADASQPLDPLPEALATAALPSVPLDPAASMVPPPPASVAALLPPGDLPGTPLTDADWLLDTVYGDHVHANPGLHLSGGISNDLEWQTNLQ